MRNTLTLLLIGAGQGMLAALYPRAAWLLVWSGLGLGVVAAADALQQPRVFGKRGDGTLAWGPCILLLPYLLLTWLLWYCVTRWKAAPPPDVPRTQKAQERDGTGTPQPPPSLPRREAPSSE